MILNEVEVPPLHTEGRGFTLDMTRGRRVFRVTPFPFFFFSLTSFLWTLYGGVGSLVPVIVVTI